MKALVPCGRYGTRLRPFTRSMPKQLFPVANRPVLEHLPGYIHARGVTDIVVGAQGRPVAEAIGDGSRPGARITCIVQQTPLGLAHCVAPVRSFLGDDDFLMYPDDHVLADDVTTVAEEFVAPRPDAQVTVCKVTDPRAFGVAKLDVEGRVAHLVENRETPSSGLSLIGVYFFTPAIHEAVASLESNARGELVITDALHRMVSHGHKVRPSEYADRWKDTGSTEDVLNCNRRLLKILRSHAAGHVGALDSLRGTVVIEAAARVVRFTGSSGDDTRSEVVA
ncbi:sugar phosphate nucleotidyltransferase [Streptomyces lancefieldiae]|uniref:Sugar phosphate nucleotidyltransferase n=1 Tax=Streptomyces lancefieldiae TaxID=3075520 RepID=A0ABU3B0I6_9ACTN|nr:sugar phosphate nucleotidyltransferase [Streptomyces sp. DSM 40712]MDT0615955.1 sugar phosphate nucleotidyltransferase [Streptomyces sp. DSM 40712]